MRWLVFIRLQTDICSLTKTIINCPKMPCPASPACRSFSNFFKCRSSGSLCLLVQVPGTPLRSTVLVQCRCLMPQLQTSETEIRQSAAFVLSHIFVDVLRHSSCIVSVNNNHWQGTRKRFNQAMIISWKSLLLCFGLSIFQACSFTVQQCPSIRTQSYPIEHRHLAAGRLHAKGSEDPEEKEIGIPQLPAMGSTSFQNQPPSAAITDQEQSSTAFVSPKFQLQYTCKVCDTRNFHTVSRLGT
jgi:hypothetical protein